MELLAEVAEHVVRRRHLDRAREIVAEQQRLDERPAGDHRRIASRTSGTVTTHGLSCRCSCV